MFVHSGTLPAIGMLLEVTVNGLYACPYTLGTKLLWGEKARFVTKRVKTRRMAIPLYSLLTRAIPRFVLVTICGASFSRVKNGLRMPETPEAISRLKAGANTASKRTIDVAK